ncbi:hypothetical protein WN48_10603 [Eufriesea mexicana]|uniref:Uncharacterized protein n=1 Tax=Eufriesea mexicana TaxID=516756 RepID=A0A310SGD1_9HYME|nr:hypothetical protein WN48_10603 [Eufriesea mexicana]
MRGAGAAMPVTPAAYTRSSVLTRAYWEPLLALLHAGVCRAPPGCAAGTASPTAAPRSLAANPDSERRGPAANPRSSRRNPAANGRPPAPSCAVTASTMSTATPRQSAQKKKFVRHKYLTTLRDASPRPLEPTYCANPLVLTHAPRKQSTDTKSPRLEGRYRHVRPARHPVKNPPLRMRPEQDNYETETSQR